MEIIVKLKVQNFEVIEIQYPLVFYVYSRGDQRHNTPALFYGAIIDVQIL